jgi:hypothetical protein
LATKVKFVTPFLTAQYPHISSPDTQGKFADNKYKTKGVMPLGDPKAQAFIAAIKAAAETCHGKAGLKLYMPFVIDEEANTVTFNFKTQYAPSVFDSRNKAIPSSQRVGGGSVLRLMGNFVEYEKGISAQFNQVQVKELNGPGVSAFDEVDDGYSYSDTAGGEPDADDTDDSAGGTPNDSLDI